MAFDADAYLRSRPPWTLTLDGRTFTAAHVSVEQALWFEVERKAAEKNEAKLRILVRRLLRMLFPWRWRYLLGKDPVRLVLRLEPAAVAALVNDFFQWWMARHLGVNPTNGTASKPSIETPSSPSDGPASA